MNVTVSARIAGGFGVVVLLLLVISIVSFSGVKSINGNLNSVVDEAAPMLQTSGHLISSLLEANNQVNRHQKQEELPPLAEFETRYDELKASFLKQDKEMQRLAQGYAGIANTLKGSKHNIEQYFTLVPEIFETHRKALELTQQIKKQRKRFEDLADELDSLIYDLSEEVKSQDVRSTLQSMGNLVREGTISGMDALNLDNITTVETVKKDLDAIAAAIKERFASLASSKAADSDSFGEFQQIVTQFTDLASGSTSVISSHLSRLNSKEASESKLREAELNMADGIANLRKVASEVKKFADQSKEQAIGQVESSQSIIVVMSLVAVGAAIFISLIVIRSIRQPLNEVVDVIGKLSEGDLTRSIKITRNDEFGTLGESVNDLVHKLRDILGGIASSSQQLAASAEQTAAIAREGHESINRQREQTELVATAMAEMTATVNEVANSASNTLHEVQGANEETNVGQGIVRQNIQTINSLASEIESASGVINKLNEYSDNIGSVLDVIRGIADQTNLLALNAAIEAARAGEQGRGFAVVADEVRTLASKTQESTSEIQEMIERLQTGTRNAVSVMEKSQTEAQISVDQTAKAGQALESITRAVGVINDMSTHIASSAEEQSAVTNEMHENIETISSLAEQNARGANESLAASQQLAKLAEQLQQMVSQFRL